MDFLNFLKSNLRWLAGGLTLTVFSSFGQTFFISLFNDKIRDAFALTDGGFGMIYMVATLASAATLVQLGKLVDRFSVAVVAAGVLLLLAVACVGMACATSLIGLFFTLFALRLFGQGMLTHTAQTAMGRWYDQERGRAVSVTSVGHNFGEAVLPALVLVFVARLGWREVWFLAAGSLVLIALPLSCWLMNSKRVPVHWASTKNRVEVKQWTRGEVLRDPYFYGLLVGILAPALIVTSFYFHHKNLLNLKGWPGEVYAAAFFLLSISTVFSKLAAGALIDRLSAVRVLPLFLLPLAAACFVLGWGQASGWIYVAVILIGLAMGFANSILGAIWPELYGVTHLGTIRSVAVAALVFSSALGPGLTGWLIDCKIDFDHQLVAMGIYCVLVAALMVWLSKRLESRQTSVE
jgi:sugar phosphate permease